MHVMKSTLFNLGNIQWKAGKTRQFFEAAKCHIFLEARAKSVWGGRCRKAPSLWLVTSLTKDSQPFCWSLSVTSKKPQQLQPGSLSCPARSSGDDWLSILQQGCLATNDQSLPRGAMHGGGQWTAYGCYLGALWERYYSGKCFSSSAGNLGVFSLVWEPRLYINWFLKKNE